MGSYTVKIRPEVGKTLWTKRASEGAYVPNLAPLSRPPNTWAHLRPRSLSPEWSPGGLYVWIGGMAGVAFKV